jgi:acyltransferase
LASPAAASLSAAPPATRAGQTARPRLAALDAARALGVLAMVMGHTLDAVLSPAARQTPAMVQYWHARGLTAPLFLLVSGWAVTLAISRSGARGWDVPRGRVRRVALLLFIGYALRWPGWAIERFAAGDRDIWSHFLAFDALHTIALSLLATSLVLALPWRRGAKAALLAALALAAVLLGMGATIQGGGPPTAAGLPHFLPAMALAQVFRGTSPFPLVPWSAYFFAGALVGLLAPQDRRGAVAMAAVGAALVVGALPFPGLGEREAGDPLLIAFRVGVVLLLLGALELVPASLAARAAPLGKSSLGVYAIHLPIVYGWSAIGGLAWRVGPTLGVGAALATAVAVLVASFVLFRGLAAARTFAARLRGAAVAG